VHLYKIFFCKYVEYTRFDLPKSKLNTELYIFCCTGRKKCTKLHIFASIFSNIFQRQLTLNWGVGKTPPPDSSLSARYPPSHFITVSATADSVVLFSYKIQLFHLVVLSETAVRQNLFTAWLLNCCLRNDFKVHSKLRSFYGALEKVTFICAYLFLLSTCWVT